MAQHLATLSRIFNTPLLIEQGKLDVVSSQIGIKLFINENLSVGVASPTNKEIPEQSSIGVIKVFDTLVSKNGGGESGSTSYESIQNQINNLINFGVNTIPSWLEGYEREFFLRDKIPCTKLLFYIDSHGGEANGCFPLSDFIYNLPIKYGIQTVAFSDGYVTSGAYAIGRACQKLYITSSTSIGSVAAIMSLVDLTEKDKMDGIKYTIRRSLEDKAAYNPHETISPEILAKLDANLAKISDLFLTNISEYSPTLSVDRLKSFKGDTFFGQEAIDNSLADKLVSSLDEVISLETSPLSLNKGNKLSNGSNKMAKTLEELNQELAEERAKNLTVQSQLNEAKKLGIAEERTRITGILSSAKLFKISDELTLKQIDRGRSVEDARDLFEGIAEATGNEKKIDLSAIPESTMQNTPNTKTKLEGPTAFLSVLDDVIKTIKPGI